jgi:hypothetical protein
MAEAAPRSPRSPRRLFGWVLRIAVAVALVAFAIPLCRRSIVLADEGYILSQSFDLLGGKVLYRDMDAFVTPGIWVVVALTFELLGPSVIASRVPAFLALLATYAAGYRIASRLAGPRYAALALALLATCTVWAFPAWTFAFYSPFSITFALLGLERLLAWRETGAARDALLCGLCLGLSVVFKQNYGVFALVGAAAGMLAIRAEQGLAGRDRARAWLRDVLRLGAGAAAAGLPFVVWLAIEGALPAAWQSLVVHPFEFAGRHDIAYLPLSAIAKPDLLKTAEEMLTYAAQPIYRVPPASVWLYQNGIVERMHVLFYWVPPVVLALGAALSYRPDPGRAADGGTFAVVAVAGMVFLGVFPRADFNHLVNVYQPVVLAGVVVAHHVLSRRPRPWSIATRVGVGTALAVLGLYAAVAAYWYAALLDHLDSRVYSERARVLDRPEQARRIDYQIGTIEAETEPGEALLTLPDLSMLNFLADRPMPSTYYNMYEHHIAHDGGAAVIRGAEESGVRLAITSYNDFFSDRRGMREYAPDLIRYLETHFEMKYTVGREDFVHLVRRAVPIELPRETKLLPYCDISRGYQEIREHLLFPALYHDPGTGDEMEAATIETPCDVPVPSSGATLSVRVDYRAPAAVVRNTTLVAEILVVGPDSKTLVARKLFRVEPQGEDVRRIPLAPEIRVDLGRWAGQSTRLLLRTIRRGKVMTRPLEPRGFGTIWQDPVLVWKE